MSIMKKNYGYDIVCIAIFNIIVAASYILSLPIVFHLKIGYDSEYCNKCIGYGSEYCKK